MISEDKSNKPDYILYNGNFISMEGARQRYYGIGIRDGKIVSVYRNREEMPGRFFGTKMVDLNGKTVLPGFIDCNLHLVQSGLLQYCLTSNATNREEFLAELKQGADTFEEGELIWCIEYCDEVAEVNRWDLDRVSSSHPVIVSKTEFHKTIVNTCAYNMMKIPSSIPGIERDAKGMPTGVFEGEASGFVRRKLYTDFVSEGIRKRALAHMEEEAFRYGITTVNAMEGGAFFSGRDIQAVKEFAEQSRMNILVFPQTMDLNQVERLNLPRIGGNIYLDGSLGSRTAALDHNYCRCSHNGILYYSQEDVTQFVTDAHSSGLQIALTCIGPRAVEQALQAFETAFETVGRNSHRHRLELFVLPTEEQVERAVSLGLLLSMRANYDLIWGGADGMYADHVGEDWKRCNPIGECVRKGGIVCGGSEHSVTPLNPLISIAASTGHHSLAQRVSAYEALKTYTVNGAYANYMEDRIGKIRIGFDADLVVLDRDITELDPLGIAEAQVLLTLKDGRPVYVREEAAWK